MPREQSDNRKRSREIFDKHEGNISNREIAGILGCSEKSISGWKYKDNWIGKKRSTPNENKRSTPKKRGGQPGNKNATGPPGNRHAEKHGFFTKWLPEETMAIFDEIKKDDPLDLLWDNIQLQYAAIIRGQKLMYVKDQVDKTVERVEEKCGNVSGEKWEVQQAWDKHATFLSAQSRAMKTLQSMIKEYDELINKNWDTATEIQKAQLDQLKAQTEKLKSDADNTPDESVQDTMDAIDGIVSQMKPLGDDEV